jgi:hypothetical protein
MLVGYLQGIGVPRRYRTGRVLECIDEKISWGVPARGIESSIRGLSHVDRRIREEVMGKERRVGRGLKWKGTGETKRQPRVLGGIQLSKQ